MDYPEERDERQTLKARISELEALLAERTAAQEWQPIESAPKDGSRVLVRGRFQHLTDMAVLGTAYWRHGVWIAQAIDPPYNDRVVPTLWAPLPAPPDTLKGQPSPPIGAEQP